MQVYKYSGYLLVVSCVLWMAGCGENSQSLVSQSPDGENDSVFVGGKADHFIGDCQSEHVLLWLNDAHISAQDLQGNGIHAQATNNIIEFRAGEDNQIGTEDDQFFSHLIDVDNVKYVGPVAMTQLVDAVSSYCDGSPWREATTYFSPLPYQDSHLDRVIDIVNEAQYSIDLAMYSISDGRVITALTDAAKRGVRVRLLFDSANGQHLRPEGTRSAQFENAGIDVRYINRIMHHKFGIIDGPQDRLLQASRAIFFSGSGNLSYSAATRYDENISFHKGDAALVLKMQQEFNHLWKHSRDLVWNESLEFVETIAITDEMIPVQSDLDVLFTSKNFQTNYSTRYGAGFTPITFSEVVADRLVEMIHNAQSSIYIAAGFLRSRPIAEALITRRQQQPDLDIRIYLDQSEYISEGYHHIQQSDVEQCLTDAGDDESAVYNCRERGFIFSYLLYYHGIPMRFKNYSYRWHYSYAEQLHHKYIIFDEMTVATGSYNFSNNAEQNTMENVVIYQKSRYPQLVSGFVNNFKSIWETGRQDNRYESLLDTINHDDSIAIVFDSIALTWDETTTLRRAIRTRCPAVDSLAYRNKPETHRTCDVQ